MNRKRSRKRSSQPLHRPNLGPILSRPAGGARWSDETRSAVFWLAVLGVMAAWGAWPEEETGQVLASSDECDRLQTVARDECLAGYEQALADHQRLAPRFDSEYQCGQQFGACSMLEEDGVAYWIPPMAGFLIGYRKRDDDRGGGGGYASGYRYAGSLPLYRERSGDFLNPNGDWVSSRHGNVHGDAGRTSAPARAITISRSGFGSVSGARSSFGS